MAYGRPLAIDGDHSPYRLHELLQRYRLQQGDLRKTILFQAGLHTGKPIASSTMSMLLVRRKWPTSITAESIVEKTAEFLRSRGVPEEEIATAWTVDGEVQDSGPPLGRDVAPLKATPNKPADTWTLPEPEMLSAAAKEMFNLTRSPFVDDVQSAKDVFLSKDQRYIRNSMYDAAKHGGFIAIVGESGSGKSTLRRDLVERVRRDEDPIVIVQPQTQDKSELTASHICDAIINDLSAEKPKLSREAKARQVQRILTGSARSGNSHVLMIEEAHDLQISTLKYLKRFWEMEDGFRRLIGIVLVGQPELGMMLDERRNYDAREVIRRCEVARLKPLNGNLEEYLKLKFDRLNCALDDVFDKSAYDAIRAKLTRRRTNGSDVESQLYPLIVNNLVTKALNQAAEMGMDKIDAELVGRL